MKLQDFGFRTSQYERPQQRWICGRAEPGAPCRTGPGASGDCQAVAECMPRKKGDRWFCTRPRACSDGPLPDGSCARPLARCVPLRSTRSRRGLAVRWVAILTLALLVLLLSGPTPTRLLSPGPVADAHGNLEQACEACHSAGAVSAAYWPGLALDAPDGERESGKCLSCHLAGDHPLRPHGLTQGALMASGSSVDTEDTSGGLPWRYRVLNGILGEVRDLGRFNCAVCHREHQGAAFDMTAMDDLQCQGCHQRRFVSLISGHTEFTDFPHRGRTGIIFDHLSHLGKHFREPEVEALAPSRCDECHRLDMGGQPLPSPHFDAACAGCHRDQVTGKSRAGDRGIPVIGPPGLDLELLRERGFGVGEWPQDADGELTPFLTYLLGTDPGMAGDLERFGALDPLDLVGASDEDLAAVERVAWALKGLLADLASGGQQVLARTLSGRDESTGALTGGLSPDVLQAALRDWFPGLTVEVEAYRSGRWTPVASPVSGGIRSGRPADAGGIPPEIAEADAILEETGTDGEISVVTDDEDDILGGLLDEGDIPEGAQDDGDILGEMEVEGDLLAREDEDLDSILGETEDGAEEIFIEFGGLNDGDLLGGADLADAAARGRAAGSSTENVSAEDWVGAGGWYRRYHTIFYRPSGHSDRFVRSWLDLSGEDARGRSLFDVLADPKGPGLCTKCHSVTDTGERRTVAWKGTGVGAEAASLNRFSHRSHLSNSGDRGCASCHEIDVDADYLSNYRKEPTAYRSNFKQLDKSRCSTCHDGDSVGDRCLTCHNYHALGVSARPPVTGSW